MMKFIMMKFEKNHHLGFCMRTKIITNYKTVIVVTCAIALASLSGCATQGNKDPLEGLNRGVYKFNDVADKAVIKPVATAYKAITPSPIRKGFNNFFSNLGSITTVLNDVLQFKLSSAFTDAGRFVINSTFGLAGFIDVAGMDKIANHKEDFGQTLGYWGVGNGAYLVLPLLGPSSLRDTTGLVFDTFTTDPITYTRNINQIRLSNQLRAAQFLDKRTELLTASDLVDEASLDPYAFTRDAYLQKRASLVQDGIAPLESNKNGFEDIDAETAIDPANSDTPTNIEAPAK
jgi:phospholipid-binding lipoprotein MlaA